ncbi:hypothetical protein [Nocardia nova]|uniref:hypothetical protein n=1 Tax=Nocardia nova TaxID=37330 RepID=UPI0011B0E265|nr:hypothetical protein [Nocardia nova]
MRRSRERRDGGLAWCGDLTGHFHMVYDPFVQQFPLTLLVPEHAPLPQCAYVPLGTGIGGVIVGAHS